MMRWIKLNGRSQRIVISGTESSLRPVASGLPPGVNSGSSIV